MAGYGSAHAVAAEDDWGWFWVVFEAWEVLDDEGEVGAEVV